MAHDIKLEVYTFQIRHKGDPKEKALSFVDTFSKKGDMKPFMEEFLKYNELLNVDETAQKSTQFRKETLSVVENSNIFSGIVESGDYGTESLIKNRDGKVLFTKGKDDLDTKPFYFLLWLPKKKNVGFLMLQRTGIYGINQLFSNLFRNFIVSQLNSLMVDFSQYVSKDLAKDYLTKGTVNQISLKKYSLPPDVADQLNLKEYEKDILSIEIRITAKKNGLPLNNKLKKFTKDGNASFFDIPSMGMDGTHKEKVKVTLGGSRRTIDLSDTLEIRPYFDIDDEVRKDPKTGHPIFNSIDSIAKQFVNDISKEIKA